MTGSGLCSFMTARPMLLCDHTEGMRAYVQQRLPHILCDVAGVQYEKAVATEDGGVDVSQPGLARGPYGHSLVAHVQRGQLLQHFPRLWTGQQNCAVDGRNVGDR